MKTAHKYLVSWSFKSIAKEALGSFIIEFNRIPTLEEIQEEINKGVLETYPELETDKVNIVFIYKEESQDNLTNSSA